MKKKKEKKKERKRKEESYRGKGKLTNYNKVLCSDNSQHAFSLQIYSTAIGRRSIKGFHCFALLTRFRSETDKEST